MNNRGTLTLRENGTLMRVYNTWRDLKGWHKTQRSQIDLCHFMRVVLIFAWVRMFFFKELPLVKLSTFESLVVLGMLSGYGWAWSAYPHETLMGSLSGLAAIVIVGLLGLGIRQFIAWRLKDVERADKLIENFIYYGFIWLWWPLFQVGRGAAWFGRNVIARFFKWLFEKHYYVPLLGTSVTPVGVLVSLAFTLWLGAMSYLYYRAWAHHWETTLIVTASVIGGVILLFVAAFGIVTAYDRHKENKRKRPVVQVEQQPQKEHELAKALWAFAVAKKHRICPLIEVTR